MNMAPERPVPGIRETGYPEGPPMSFERVRARWAREAVVPDALARACVHAPVGVYCWPSTKGVCGDRVRAREGARHER